MPEKKLKNIWTTLCSRLKAVIRSPQISAPFRRLGSFITSWWQVLLLAFCGFLLLYYPLGGWLINKIDTTTDYEINTADNQSATVEMMSFLIKREVSDHMWTPNLPFVFPSYFLDNMPAFQMGMMSSVSKMADAFSRRLDKTIAPQSEMPLKTAAKLLKYPGTVWMFSPQNKLVPVPSANSQYKKARKLLIAYNQSLRDGSETFYKSPRDLSYFLRRLSRSLWLSNEALESHIRENSSSWFDNRSDNVFYYQQGKLYADYLLVKALGSDYKDIIVSMDLYTPWTQLQKALEDASALHPAIVRNGELGSTSAPNHLASLGFYTLKAAFVSQNIVYKIDKLTSQEKPI